LSYFTFQNSSVSFPFPERSWKLEFESLLDSDEGKLTQGFEDPKVIENAFDFHPQEFVESKNGRRN
jgi:hypothetical protein